MKILITGLTGFLGKSIFKKLEEGNEISGLSRNSGNYKISLEKKIPIFNDIFDVVIHAAGKAHSVPKTEIQKKEFYDVNVVGTQNLLKGLENMSLPKAFIFISSVSVYGQDIGNNINENHPLQAKDSYGLSKIKAEKLVTKWCEENKVVCTILRLPLLVGKDAPGNLGAMIKAIINGYYFNIGGGTARKSMVLAEDIASFVVQVALVGGIYNLTDGFHPSFKELSFAICENKNKKRPKNLDIILVNFLAKFGDALGNKAPINSLKVKKMISDLTFDDSKARTTLNWNPKSVIEYLKNNEI